LSADKDRREKNGKQQEGRDAKTWHKHPRAT
jgi:hypothetical protein